MLQMGNGDLRMGVPDINLAMVDVRDTAKAHILARLRKRPKDVLLYPKIVTNFLI